MKLLMTTDAVGGVWTYSVDLARALSSHGVATTMAILGPAPSVEQRAVAAGIDGLAVVETGLALDWTAERPGELAAVARSIAELAAAVGADLVHLNTPALAADACFARPVVAACHSCVTTWWEAVGAGPLPPDLAWRSDATRRGLAAASALIAPSAAFAAATATAYDLRRPPLVIHNGRRTPEDRERGEADEGSFVLTAGRLWDRGKGVDALDRAAARLSLPVRAAGPIRGPDGSSITLAHARWLGDLAPESLASQMARRPIYASMARYEPFGLAVLEAAQAGCPLVLADQPTFRELWDGAALFAPLGDDDALVAALESVAGDAGRRRALSAAGRERARRYDVDRMATRTLSLYRAILAKQAVAA